MPLQRFRDFEEAREALWMRRDDPQLVPRIRALWAFASRLAPGPAPRGVRKYESMEAAAADRDAWTVRRVRDLREARLRERSP